MLNGQIEQFLWDGDCNKFKSRLLCENILFKEKANFFRVKICF